MLDMPGQVVDFPAWPIYGIMPAHKTLMSFNFTTGLAHTQSTSPKNLNFSIAYRHSAENYRCCMPLAYVCHEKFMVTGHPTPFSTFSLPPSTHA